MKRIICILAVLLLLVCGCAAKEKSGYEQISMSEGIEMMERLRAEGEEFILIDVRTKSEYDEGHIPGAVLIPNETIGEDDIKELPDKDMTVFVYCRSGNRSKQAAAKLDGLGYTDVIEIGGIISYTGEIEK